MPVFRRSIGSLRRRPQRSGFFLFRWISPYMPQIMKTALFFGILAFMIGTMTVIVVLKQMPDIGELSSFLPSETTKIFSADGTVLADLHLEENRVIIPGRKISKSLRMAVVAVEDGNFYSHFGLDLKAIVRALTVDVFRRRLSQGASTITQQLARNVFLSKKKKIIRKITEAVLAIQIEKYYTKDEILEMYLNQVYWGHNCYGIEAGSLYYFGKSSKDLNLAESAMLAGMLKAPEYYSPYKNMERARQRQRVVLRRMVAEKMINKDQAEAVAAQEITLTAKKKEKYKAPHFTSYVVEKLISDFGQEKVYHQGLRVYTTLDYRLQQIAEEVVSKFIEIGLTRGEPPSGNPEITHNFEEAALLAVDPRTGYIKTMVGGSDFSNNEFNHCVQAQRPPGSSFKPFNYLTAISMGFSPGSVMEDAAVTYNTIFGPYSPTNFSQKFHGTMMLQEALQRSINNIAVRVINLIGPSNVVKTAQKLGVRSTLQPVLSLTLGSSEVNMLEMASAYGVLANSGIRVEPTGITKITDREGNILYKHTIREKQVYEKNPIHILISMMRRVVMYGTGRGANLRDRPVAGKTGTTDDYKDAWFIGFIPQMVTAAWVGNDNNIPMDRVTGGFYPARMWREFMTEVTREMPVIQFPKMKNMKTVNICKTTGYLPGSTCPPENIINGLFQDGKEPEDVCWYDHSLPRDDPANDRSIVPPGWEGRNLYEEVITVDETITANQSPDWLIQMEQRR
ncbi:transglycosylase domain-containing protein [Candidatus Margulisiibacteriota bacterium]